MDIIRHKNIFLLIGGALMAGSIAILFIFGFRLGIDFAGGSLTEVVYDTAPEQSVVEEAVTVMDLGGVSVRETVGAADRAGYMIRTRDLSDDERQTLTEIVLGLGDEGEITRFTSIGPVIGAELAEKAKWAIAGIAIIIIFYVAIAFMRVGYPVRSYVYGGITIIALIHDILIPAAVMSILGVVAGAEVDVLFVTALLAVLGYSVNDTIVVFDRVRENLHKYRTEHTVEKKDVTGVIQKETTYTLDKPFAEIVNTSVMQVITRSINTSVTTLLALGALYVFGGSTTQIFALILMTGVVAGTYSSIFLASPLLVAYAERVLKLDVTKANTPDTSPTSANPTS